MANFKQYIQRVFKGENDLDQPELIEEDEVLSAVNLLPFLDSRGLRLREGFATVYDTTADNVLAVFNKRLLNGTLVTLYAVVDGSVVNVMKTADGFATAPVLIGSHSYSANTPGFWFADWDGDRVFWSDGVHGLWTYDFTNPAAVVTDKQTGLPVDSWTASDTFTGADGALPAPWVLRNGTVTIYNNEAKRTAGATDMGIAAHTTNTCQTAWSVEVGAPAAGAIVYSGVASHIQANDDCYVWTHWGTSPKLRLCIYSSGSLTTLASYDTAGALAVTKLKMVRAGDQLIGYNFEGGVWVERARYTLPASPLSGGNPGIFIGTLNAAVDNFAAASSDDPGNAAPSMRYLTNHRGRLFGAKGTDDTVYFCGTDDSDFPRWENWSHATGHGTNTIVDDGGSLKIAPYGRKVRGLLSNERGLVVFKDDCIVAWDWEDSSAPWEVAQGVRTTVISSGITLANHEAVSPDGNGFYFAGLDQTRKLSFHRYSNGSIEPLTVPVPGKFLSLSPDVKVESALIDNILFVVAQEADESVPEIQMMYDTRIGGWFSVDGPTIQCASHGAAGTYSLFGSAGKLLRYPSGVYTDEESTPISFELAMRAFDADAPFDDKFFRVFWYEAGASGGVDITTTFSGKTVGGPFEQDAGVRALNNTGELLWGAEAPETPVDPVPADLVWDDPGERFLWDSTGDSITTYVPLGLRCLNLSPKLTGTADDEFFINSVGVAYRPRKPVSV